MNTYEGSDLKDLGQSPIQSGGINNGVLMYLVNSQNELKKENVRFC